MIFQGVWEDLSAKQANFLKGHRVEIRLLDGTEGTPEQTRNEVWADFEARIGEITKGWTFPNEQLLTAAAFYESCMSHFKRFAESGITPVQPEDI
jgi:hypothetical protein